MEKLIQPPTPAKYHLWCDATGKDFWDENKDLNEPKTEEELNLPAPIELTLEFNYGSVYDGAKITLHYSDKSFQPILDCIVSTLGEKTKEEMGRLITDNQTDGDLKHLINNALLKRKC